MSNEIIAGVVTTILVLLGVILPGVLGYILKAAKYAKETGELLTTVGIAFEDKKLTADEIVKILKEAKDIKDLALKSGSQGNTIKQLQLENKRLKIKLNFATPSKVTPTLQRRKA